MATLRGVEPRTSCFVGKRSIQLSYRVVSLMIARKRRLPKLSIRGTKRELAYEAEGRELEPLLARQPPQ
jgi:hypothetical protein